MRGDGNEEIRQNQPFCTFLTFALLDRPTDRRTRPLIISLIHMKYVAVGTKTNQKATKNTTETRMGEVTMGIAHLEKCYFGCHDETFLFFFPSIPPMLVVREKTVAG